MMQWWWRSLIFLLLLAAPVQAQQTVRLADIICPDGTKAVTTAVSLTYSGAADKLVVTGAVSKKVYLYAYVLHSDTAAITLKWRSATTGGGATCPTAAADVTGVFLTYSASNQSVDSGELLIPLSTPAGADLCLRASAGSVISGYTLTCVSP